jgi:hypothetical protein
MHEELVEGLDTVVSALGLTWRKGRGLWTQSCFGSKAPGAKADPELRLVNR